MIAREYRLRKATDFSKTYKFGKSYNHPEFYIKSLQSKLPLSRFAVVIPKKVAKSAVVRNRARRRVYEIVRINLSQIKPGYTIIITLKSDLVSIKPKELEQQLVKGLQGLHIL